MNISKPKLPRGSKFILIALSITFLTLTGFLALADGEGVFADTEGQLNNPFTLICNSGILADRRIDLPSEGEYNWMLAIGQSINITVWLETIDNNSVLVSFSNGPATNPVRQDVLHSANDTISWALQIPYSGHWRLEFVNYSGVPVGVQIHVIAGSSGSFGILNCINPRDLFRWDRD